MSPQPTMRPTEGMRELNSRTGDGLSVTLYLHSPTNGVWLEVCDAKDDGYEFVKVRAADVQFAFTHPFAFLAMEQTPPSNPILTQRRVNGEYRYE